jgi:cell division protein FtsZ
VIGLGAASSPGDRRALEAVQEALNSPLLDADVKSANSVLVNVTGPTDLSIGEAENVVEFVQSKVKSNARIIWGANVDPTLDADHTLKVTLVVTGVTPGILLKDEGAYAVDTIK